MAYLIVNSVTVPVSAEQGVTVERERFGDAASAFDGTELSTVRVRKLRWNIVTAPMSRSDADSLISALEDTLPLACSGDLTGSVDCNIGDISEQHTAVSAGELVAVTFQLREA